MKSFTYEELKRGLLCCTVYKDCKNCPCFDKDTMTTASAGDVSCTSQLMAAAMNCINEMENDIMQISALAARWEYIIGLAEQSGSDCE